MRVCEREVTCKQASGGRRRERKREGGRGGGCEREGRTEGGERWREEAEARILGVSNHAFKVYDLGVRG